MRPLTPKQAALAAKIRKSIADSKTGTGGPVIMIDDADWPGWSDAELMALLQVEHTITVDADNGTVTSTRAGDERKANHE